MRTVPNGENWPTMGPGPGCVPHPAIPVSLLVDNSCSVPKTVSELKARIVKTLQKTLEWSTNLTVLLKLAVLRGGRNVENVEGSDGRCARFEHFYQL